ncbi:LamG-like jellyroll fold domain-containing protein [Flexithrix dorotheae]|uniref:LamG-like jellyroll fold domain-containing protein n=1 Tax=Flexithrix dorotheae TaxID=70993 RepID=UPI0003720CB4|nr:LamG-like jellyroll fold domain-containing protein [Flexithrix dorotheae]
MPKYHSPKFTKTLLLFSLTFLFIIFKNSEALSQTYPGVCDFDDGNWGDCAWNQTLDKTNFTFNMNMLIHDEDGGGCDADDWMEYMHYYYEATGVTKYRFLKVYNRRHAALYDQFVDNIDGCSEATHDYGYNPYNNNNTSGKIISRGATGGEYFKVQFQFAFPPSLIGKTVTIGVEDGWGDGMTFHGGTKQYTIPLLPTPGALNSTAGCGKVDLSWDEPEDMKGYPGDYVYVIYENDVQITTLPAGTTSYTRSTTTNKGYKISLRYVKNGITYESSKRSVQGEVIAQLGAPAGLEATQNLCDGSSKLTWQWAAANPKNFKLYRSNTEGGTYTAIATISGEKRSYVNTGLTRGSTYYYKMSAISKECDTEGDISDFVPGISPADPTAAANFQMELIKTGTAGVELTWSAGSHVEMYKIVRRGINGGEETFDIDNPTTTSYLDQDAESCATYEYEIFSVNGCKEVSGGKAKLKSDNTKDEINITDIDVSKVLAKDSLTASKGYFGDRVLLEWSTGENANFINRYKIYRRKLGSDVVPQLMITTQTDVRTWTDNSTNARQIYEYFVIGENECGIEKQITFDINLVNGKDYQSLALPANGVAYTLGFRLPFGVVNGNIVYEGGIAVPDVKVIAERQEGTSGNALSFDGTDDFVQINGSDFPTFTNELTLSAWINPDTLLNDQYLITKQNQFEVKLNNAGNIVTTVQKSGGAQTLTSTIALNSGDYSNVTVTMDTDDSLKIYINGVLSNSLKIATGNLTTNSNDIYLGRNFTASGYFNGNIDEVRVYSRGLDSLSVLRDYGRLVNPDDDGLEGYWRFDEGLGPFVFDASEKGGKFHGRDGIINGALWSDSIPTGSQLATASYTDDAGNYSITGIIYEGNGGNFNITPTMTMGGAIHAFDPSQQIVYLGEGSSVENGVDFKDISSFRVTGNVYFTHESKNNLQEVGSKGVNIFIDGEIAAVKNGKLVETDENGAFDIQVPIGHHFLEFRKLTHTIQNEGRYPVDRETKDFQAPVSGIVMLDSTTKILVGRGVGGPVERDKLIGFGKSVNNIGQIEFTLESANDGGLVSETITTNLANGEYQVSLPPKEYKVKEVKYIDDGSYVFKDSDGTPLAQENLDMSALIFDSYEKDSVYQTLPDTIVYVNEQGFVEKDTTGLSNQLDTLEITRQETQYKFNETTQQNDTILVDVKDSIVAKLTTIEVLDNIDSVKYHFRRDFILRNKPIIIVTDEYGRDFSTSGGDQELKFKDNAGTTFTADLSSLPYKVFRQGQPYKMRIFLYEIYTNIDDSKTHKVPVTDAELSVSNGLGRGFYLEPDGNKDQAVAYSSGGLDKIRITDGDTLYNFKAGEPNLLENASVPSESYLKSLTIQAKAGSNIIEWPAPGGGGAPNPFKAYVLGGLQVGNNFITQGPELVDFILRDPPMDGSYSYLTKGSSFSSVEETSHNFDGSASLKLKAQTGAKILKGVGVITESKAVASKSGTLGLKTGGGFGEENVYSYEATTSFKTRSAGSLVGASSDLFVGTSKNIIFGIIKNLAFVEESDCGLSTVECPVEITVTASDGSTTKTLKLARFKEMAFGRGGIATTFVYDQNHIENYLIPNLKALRDNLLQNNAKYVNNVTSAAFPSQNEEWLTERIGTNNDNLIWGADIQANDLSPTKADGTLTSNTGKSYTFTPTRKGEIDSVRWFNQQINTWINTLARNEVEKWLAIKGYGVKQSNVSISAQSEYSYEYSAEWEDTNFDDFYIGPFGSLGTETDLKESGSGVSIDYNISLSNTNTVSSSESNGQSFKVGYVINDDDVGDYHTINIYGNDQDTENLGKDAYKSTPIFETLAGQTACPHEDEVVLRFATSSYVGGLISKNQQLSLQLAASILYIQQTIDYRVGDNSYPPAATAILDEVKDAKNRSILSLVKQKKKLEERKKRVDKKLALLNTLKGSIDSNKKEILSSRTQQRDKPGITINGTAKVATAYNIPADQTAAFLLNFNNESETDDNQYYVLEVIESTNPDGLVMRIDGQEIFGNRQYFVPGGKSITKTLVVERGPFEFNYDSVQLVLHSACQYDLTGNGALIDDTVTISAFFIPSCTEPNIFQPQDNWTINTSLVDSTDTTRVLYQIGGFNINYPNFQAVELQYKSSGDSDAEWILLDTYYRDSLARAELGGKLTDPLIDKDGDGTIKHIWKQAGSKTLNGGYVWTVPDGEYDLKAITLCGAPGDITRVSSEIFSGIIDRETPHAFGAPQPSDGVLSAGDEIMIQFNEPINAGLLRPANFDIRGVLNGTDLRHPASLYFDGTDNSYMEIPEGNSLTRRSFSVEFYVKRETSGQEEILFSQGFEKVKGLFIGFDNTDSLMVTVVDATIKGNQKITADDKWHHVAFTYDVTNNSASIHIDGFLSGTHNSFSPDYLSTGKITIGKSHFSGNPSLPFAGNIHELRIWKKALSTSQVNIYAGKRMSGNEPGLSGNWRMEEAFGTIAEDLASNRHATVNATWQVEPNGNAVTFNGTDAYLKTKSPAINNDMDFTMEFWFNANGITNQTLLSNGRGDTLRNAGNELLDANKNGWSVNANASGLIEVWNYGKKFQVTDKNFFDGKWHHLALVVKRRTNTTCYIDGLEQNTVSSIDFFGFGGPALWLGARGWVDQAGATNITEFYNGKLDEIRFWQTARPLTQIKRDMHFMLTGDEPGLLLYHPFDRYQEVAGIQELYATYVSTAISGSSAILDTIKIGGGAQHTDVTPTVKIPRPVQKVNFNYSANNDKIILTTNDPDSLLENVILDITVKNVEDMNANVMASPVSWTAFVDKNQVVWDDEDLHFEIEQGNGFEFESRIRNTGGKFAEFEIKNLPPWLSVEPSSGTLPPVSSQLVTFVVNPNVNIGKYSEDIQLVTEFGFEEVLLLDLKVFKPLPEDWTVDASKYQFSMNIIAQVEINGEISRDPDDVVAAFINGECRGLAELKYIPAFDNYQAFVSIYSNQSGGEAIKFRVWNASDGQVHRDLTPTYSFNNNAFHGTPGNPELLIAEDVIEHVIPTPKGWKWLSFHLQSNEMQATKKLFKELNAAEKDVIKGIDKYDQYSAATGWFGKITQDGGLQNGTGYKLYLSNEDELKYTGRLLKGDEVTINVQENWNWLGYIGFKSMDINDALAGFTNATSGDIIKSQYAVAIYVDETIGWIGNLTHLHPGEGYMLKADKAGSFNFPNVNLSAGSRMATFPRGVDARGMVTESVWEMNPHEFNSSMTAVLEVADVQDVNSRLAAMVNGECRGIAYPIFNPITQRNTYFMTIYGEVAQEKIKFQFMDGEFHHLYPANESIQFDKESLKGSVEKPFVITLDYHAEALDGEEDATTMIGHPNPFGNELLLEFNHVEAKKLTIFITDATGKVIHTEILKDQDYRFTHKISTKDLSSGIYLVRVEFEDGKTLVTRVAKN